MYGTYLLHSYDVYVPEVKNIDICLTTAEFHPRRKKIKGYQKNRK
jgi:hypothetical protein